MLKDAPRLYGIEEINLTDYAFGQARSPGLPIVPLFSCDSNRA